MAKLELGAKVKDRITGFTGIAVGRTEHINGCVRWDIEPIKTKKDGNIGNGYSLEEQRLKVLAAPKEFRADRVEFRIKLGSKVRNTINGFAGIAVKRTQGLFGIARIGIESQELHDGKPIDILICDDQEVELVAEGAPYRAPLSIATAGGPPTRTYESR